MIDNSASAIIVSNFAKIKRTTMIVINPRQEDSNEILLFQLDSQDHILWGDSGVGNFFISKEDLKNKDFSHVRYNWDCY